MLFDSLTVGKADVNEVLFTACSNYLLELIPLSFSGKDGLPSDVSFFAKFTGGMIELLN